MAKQSDTIDNFEELASANGFDYPRQNIDHLTTINGLIKLVTEETFKEDALKGRTDFPAVILSIENLYGAATDYSAKNNAAASPNSGTSKQKTTYVCRVPALDVLLPMPDKIENANKFYRSFESSDVNATYSVGQKVIVQFGNMQNYTEGRIIGVLEGSSDLTYSKPTASSAFAGRGSGIGIPHVDTIPGITETYEQFCALSIPDRIKKFEPLINEACQNIGAGIVTPAHIKAFIHHETSVNPFLISRTGARGLTQFMPGTAKQYADKKEFQRYNEGIDGSNVNPHVPRQGIYLAVSFIKVLLKEYKGDLYKAAAAYNAGPGAVNKAVISGGQNWKNFLYNETKNYIADSNERSVPNLYNIYRQSTTAS
jgi:hypothetical protein